MLLHKFRNSKYSCHKFFLVALSYKSKTSFKNLVLLEKEKWKFQKFINFKAKADQGKGKFNDSSNPKDKWVTRLYFIYSNSLIILTKTIKTCTTLWKNNNDWLNTCCLNLGKQRKIFLKMRIKSLLLTNLNLNTIDNRT